MGKMNINSLVQIETIFKSHDVEQIYIKRLSLKQDNDKNQIYLGNTSGLSNLFPSMLKAGNTSESSQKGHSSKGKSIIYAELNYYWLDEKGEKYKAPNAKNINYFQYAKSGEVRLSGFISKCKNPPDCLRREKQEIYGKRILILGFNRSGETFGLAINEKEDSIVSNFPDFKNSEFSDLIQTYIIGSGIQSSARDLLREEIRKLSGSWQPSITLTKKGVKPVPFKGNQGNGYTLEALLGIPRNSSKSPDKYGFEIKSFKSKSGKIALMTPTADEGEEGRLSFREFMSLYGWERKSGGEGKVFNGVHRYRKQNSNTNLTLDIRESDAIPVDEISESNNIVVGLYQITDPQLISGWSFQKLLDSWSEKHSSACYVEYIVRPYTGIDEKHDNEYKYTGKVYFAIGTHIFFYLDAIKNDIVFYDPGHSMSPSGKTKQRPQWRIGVIKELEKRLGHLYNEVYKETLIESI
jgi:hypothetical protein